MSAPENERRNSTRLKIKAPSSQFVANSRRNVGRARERRLHRDDFSFSGRHEFGVETPVGEHAASVVTSDPQVGNGIRFMRLLPEDMEELRAYLATADKSA